MKKGDFLRTASLIGEIGMLFDIQRFSLNDGPGIRTVVFFKGCPLRCAWCFNPESFASREQLMFLDDKCTNCGICVTECPDDALAIVDGKLKVDFGVCTACGKCEEVCLSQAMRKVGYQATVEEIVEIVKRDRNYYGSTGGATLSGGEAMFQPQFTAHLLRALKTEGIHTCIETCGYASREHYEAILDYTDVFLWDYKLTFEQDHIQWTKVSNQLILENLDFVSERGAKIFLRCPVIPGVNDNDAHFKAIAGLAKKYPNIEHVEINPYVNYGVNKYARIGRKACLFGNGAKARRHESTKARRHESTKARRHEGTKARKHEGTKARRHESTKARKHEGTKARRHEGTKARRHESTKARKHESTKARKHESTKA